MTAAKAYSLLCKKENAHEDPIYCCAWTKIMPTGDSNEKAKDYIVTAGLDGISKVWEIKNNKLELLHVLKGHSMAIVSVAISPDGYTLATTSLDSILIIWELSTGNKVHEIETGSIDTWKVAFSPDGTKVVSSTHTGKLIIYDVEKKNVLKVLDTRAKFALCVSWSKDSKFIASGNVDGNICIFDETQGKLIHTVEAHTEGVRSIEFSPNSKLVITASSDGFVKLFNVASGDLQASLELKTWVLQAGFSPDGACIAAGTGDGEVVIASTSGLKILKTFQDHSKIVWGVQFNSSSEKVVSVSKDKSINIYECPKLQTIKK
ncbi:unnamed protein product [Pieris macdunnoughi]|uniref:WDR19 first beta-propeller domain-containing protein n=1 Tax=Pieris macdunnoughi TaxID=345717 RepID=A0A821QIX1_9NEOP|nr:unnamed protein product [Pieris macdunnoughi]